MRISDWSSDVCSSDLLSRAAAKGSGGRKNLVSVAPANSKFGMNSPQASANMKVHRGFSKRRSACARFARLRCDQGLVSAPFRSSRKSTGFAECAAPRSEEHTSELQSLMRISYAVFCLKKKKR